MISPTTPPEACPIAFKEWRGVCDALREGRQSLILRKGGVSDGVDGFRPEHSAFWLYPTFVHEAEQGLRTTTGLRAETPGEVGIDCLAVVDWIGRVARVEQLDALAELHDWTETSILGRFHYRTPGLWALVVRIYRRPEVWPVKMTPAHLGCKTWVPLETPPPTSGVVPVLDDEESRRRLARTRLAIEVDAA